MTNQLSTLWTGNYIVAAKTKYLEGKHYKEKIQALSQGFGANPGSLISASNLSAQTFT